MARSGTAPTAKLARAHEAAVPRLAALLRQLERIHKAHAARPAPPELMALAAAALGSARAVVGDGAVPPLPKPPLGPAVLATLVAQALAGLETYQSEHARWDERRAACCWVLRDGVLLPVARLLPLVPRPGQPMPKPLRSPESERMREKVLKLFDIKISDSYDQGFRDARDGRPHKDGAGFTG